MIRRSVVFFPQDGCYVKVLRSILVYSSLSTLICVYNAYICTYIYIYMCVSIHIYTYVCICVVYIYIYIHVLPANLSRYIYTHYLQTMIVAHCPRGISQSLLQKFAALLKIVTDCDTATYSFKAGKTAAFSAPL